MCLALVLMAKAAVTVGDIVGVVARAVAFQAMDIRGISLILHHISPRGPDHGDCRAYGARGEALGVVPMPESQPMKRMRSAPVS